MRRVQIPLRHLARLIFRVGLELNYTLINPILNQHTSYKVSMYVFLCRLSFIIKNKN